MSDPEAKRQRTGDDGTSSSWPRKAYCIYYKLVHFDEDVDDDGTDIMDPAMPVRIGHLLTVGGKNGGPCMVLDHSPGQVRVRLFESEQVAAGSFGAEPAGRLLDFTLTDDAEWTDADGRVLQGFTFPKK